MVKRRTKEAEDATHNGTQQHVQRSERTLPRRNPNLYRSPRTATGRTCALLICAIDSEREGGVEAGQNVTL